MNEKVLIFGASGHAKVAIDILNYTGYDVTIVIDNKESLHGTKIMGIPIVSEEKLLDQLEKGITSAFVAIGDNAIRVEIGNKLKLMGFNLVTAIHHNAIVADTSKIGVGAILAAGSIINPNVHIGNFAIINTGATIDHDCFISEGAHISPGVNLAGNVRIGEKAHVGIGSCVIQGINIARDTIIGAGSVVVRDISSNVIAYGSPARVMKELN